jgi:[ribosomal protein S5]-alanine N-acetyltransferase
MEGRSRTLACGDASLETPRLTLRRLRPDDLAFSSRLHSDPRVRRHLGSGRPLTAEASRAFLESILASYERIGLGQLAVVRKSDGDTIGRCGLSYMEIEPPPHELPQPRAYTRPGAAPPGTRVAVERGLGYTFDSAVWGNGDASEAAGAVFHDARERLGIARIISVIDAENAASLGVARKCGLEREDAVWMSGRAFDRYRWP